MKYFKKAILSSLATAGMLLSGWGTAPLIQAAEDVTYLLPAPGFLPAFSPWMMAKHRGYFEAEGLNVTFQVAKGGVDVAKQVGAGNAMVGGAIGDTPILVRSNGVPVKSVAVLGGRSLMQLVINKGKGIQSIKDLKGKTITTLAFQDTTFFALLGMLASQGLNKNDVNAQAVGPVNVWKMFVAGEADAMASVPDWTYLALQMRPEWDIEIIPSDTHFRSMAQAIIVSDQVIEERPELVRSLVRATLKGLRDIMEDPAGASIDYVKAVPQHKGKEKDMEGTFRMFTKYVYSGQSTLGEMDVERLTALQQFYLDQGIIRRTTPVEELYTNEFIR
jgi:NitT/TauT family transport system substrate-binding protein